MTNPGLQVVLGYRNGVSDKNLLYHDSYYSSTLSPSEHEI